MTIARVFLEKVETDKSILIENKMIFDANKLDILGQRKNRWLGSAKASLQSLTSHYAYN